MTQRDSPIFLTWTLTAMIVSLQLMPEIMETYHTLLTTL